MGPTKVFKTIYSHPNSIRGRFGLTDTRNATHGSGNYLICISNLCVEIFLI